ncbi:MmcQ/YjbR family DNA-binding protein [Cohnella zeiphila]|uniref:MmcQ/YjbR family DNA-binding protein n=1 Tax=Cohnella zeiphila TaxID=2761120 RepID=A0A7X0SI31_9BACL|nr:MmcQ/YjbR family DNA-binding protein [Cohnella zeiphila]MBB6730271.1 MmcQ/YjbR family DNA-binding protein [Cohnella zeiphila]
MEIEESARSLSTELGLRARERIRSICADYPEVREKVDGHGHTIYQVLDKSFVRIGEKADGGCAVALKVSRPTQELLLAEAGTPFFKTPYIGHQGWVSFPAEIESAWKEALALTREGYCLAAPKRLAAKVQSAAR